MKEEKQKTLSGCHAEAGTEFRAAYGVQTCMGIIENNLVEVPIVKGDLLTHIVLPSNMNLAEQCGKWRYRWHGGERTFALPAQP